MISSLVTICFDPTNFQYDELLSQELNQISENFNILLKAMEGLNIFHYETHNVDSLGNINDKLNELYETFQNYKEKKSNAMVKNYVFHINEQKENQKIEYIQKIDTKYTDISLPHCYRLQFAISESKVIAFPDGLNGILFSRDNLIKQFDQKDDLLNSMKDEKILIACYSLFGADNIDDDYKY